MRSPMLAAEAKQRRTFARMLRRLRLFEDWPDPELAFLA